MRDWAATLPQVGGAEVIHFKGMINDTINPCLGHCRGGQGRSHTSCSRYALALISDAHTQTEVHTQLVRAHKFFSLGHLKCRK